MTSKQQGEWTSGKTYRHRDGAPYQEYNCIIGRNFKESKGSLTSQFHKRLNRGELIPYTSWHQYEDVSFSSDSTAYLKTSSHTYDYFDHYLAAYHSGGDFDIGAPDTPSVDDLVDGPQLVQQAGASLFNRAFDLSTFLAEAPETIYLWQHIAKELEKGRNRGVNFGSLSSAWLLGRYGLRPLMYDIQDLNDLIVHWSDPETFRASTVSRQPVFSAVYTKEQVFESSNLKFSITWDRHYRLSALGRIAADVSIPDIILEPLVTGWELLPFSFVLDFIITIGDALKALALLRMSSAYTAAWGYRLDVSDQMRANALWTDSSTTLTFGGSLTHDWSEVKRIPTYLSFIPSPTLDLDAYKILDLVALASVLKIVKKIRYATRSRR